MNTREFHNLLSQRKALKDMLDKLAVTSILERGSLQASLEELDHIIQENSARILPDLAKARLTFNGKPVIGSYGIYADFATKALSSFTEMITAVAASLSEPLAAKGPIPNKDQNQLIITSTALGSFGFELEEYRPPLLAAEEESPVSIALDRAQQIFEGMTGTDDELADSIVETDPRTMDKIKTFLNVLADNESVCAFQIKDRTFRFSDVSQIRDSISRISSDNIFEESRHMEGFFHGFIPKTRTFEFKPVDQEDTIVGKALSSLVDVGQINSHLNEKTKMTVLVKRVGHGKPRYQMVSTPEWLKT